MNLTLISDHESWTWPQIIKILCFSDSLTLITQRKELLIMILPKIDILVSMVKHKLYMTYFCFQTFLKMTNGQFWTGIYTNCLYTKKILLVSKCLTPMYLRHPAEWRYCMFVPGKIKGIIPEVKLVPGRF